MICVYVVNVGQGNMAVAVFPDNYVIVYDCNITNDNEDSVFRYLSSFMPKNSIDLFVNSHRDADHMRGVRKLHERYPITSIWDSDVSANTGTPEYEQYMRLRREVVSHVVSSGNYLIAHPEVKVLNGKRGEFDDPNSQSIVLTIDYNGSKMLLAGDTDSLSWARYIVPEHQGTLSTLVLYASHHGSYTFFNVDHTKWQDYTDHLRLMNPAIAIISVSATNPHGHPHPKSVGYYNAMCTGCANGTKVFRTDERGHMKVELHGAKSGQISWDR